MELWTKRQRFRNSDFGGRSSHLGERPPQLILEKFVIRRSFFRIGRTTAQFNFVRSRAGRSVGSFGANDRRSLCFFYSFGRIWAVDRLVLGERPATALLNFNLRCFERSIAPLRRTTGACSAVEFILASKKLCFRASSPRFLCFFINSSVYSRNLLKTHKT